MAAETRELTFDDILILQRIDAESVLERFGSKINASFFEAANLLGTLKLKGLVDIEASPGLSKVWLTPTGKSVLEKAKTMAGEEISPLDFSILQAVARGAKDAKGAAAMLNIRSSDLAFHLNKLFEQGFIDSSFKMGKVTVVLTEKGFMHVSDSLPPLPAMQQPAGQQPAQLAPALKKSESSLLSLFRRARTEASKAATAASTAASGAGTTIADELSPGDEGEAGKQLTPEELKARMKNSKSSFYSHKWVGPLALLITVLFIIMLAVYIMNMRG
ncbi:MAG: hypothetical protein Q7T16_03155 [Candidatus Burarchaeum sp.]|nr:hypothetical protein [Candidatus Burarchaeum sp.]MDO8339631.1 hypothetical protein [Candidatus Burarchaeum sp.]